MNHIVSGHFNLRAIKDLSPEVIDALLEFQGSYIKDRFHICDYIVNNIDFSHIHIMDEAKENEKTVYGTLDALLKISKRVQKIKEEENNSKSDLSEQCDDLQMKIIERMAELTCGQFTTHMNDGLFYPDSEQKLVEFCQRQYCSYEMRKHILERVFGKADDTIFEDQFHIVAQDSEIRLFIVDIGKTDKGLCQDVIIPWAQLTANEAKVDHIKDINQLSVHHGLVVYGVNQEGKVQLSPLPTAAA